MSASRHIPLPLHGLIELICGIALVLAPFVLPVDPAGLVLSVGFGVLFVGLALGGEDGLPVSAHVAFDQSLAIGAAGAALALALSGDGLAALPLAIAATVELVLSMVTRYAPPAVRR